MSERWTTVVGNRAQGKRWLATPIGAWLDGAMRRRGLRHDRELLEAAVVCREAIAALCRGGGQVDTLRRLVAGLERIKPMGRAEMLELTDALLTAAPKMTTTGTIKE